MSQPSPLSQPLPWNLVADGYAEELIPHFSLYAEDALRLTEVVAGEHVLDVATGPGTLAILAARQGAAVTAVDFAEEMLARLRTRAEREAVAIDARQTDGMALPFADGSFDAALSMFGVIFFPDPLQGLRELRRVVREGGRVIVSSWTPLREVPLFAVAVGTFLEHALGGPPPDVAATWGAPEELATALRDAGLRDVRVEQRTHVVASESVERAWASLVRSTAPIVLFRSRLGEERFTEISNKVVDTLRAHFGERAPEARLTANIGLGRR